MKISVTVCERTLLSPRSFRRKPGSDKQRLRLVLFPTVFAATHALAVKEILINMHAGAWMTGPATWLSV